MNRNPVEAVLGFAVLIFVAVFVMSSASHLSVKTVDGYPLMVSFDKVGGLEIGADVRIKGIKIGSVTAINSDTDSYMAQVRLSVRNDIKLPIDTVAVVADSGLMGDKYIRLEPGQDKRMIQTGGRISKTRDYKTLEDSVSEFIFLSTKDDKS